MEAVEVSYCRGISVVHKMTGGGGVAGPGPGPINQSTNKYIKGLSIVRKMNKK